MRGRISSLNASAAAASCCMRRCGSAPCKDPEHLKERYHGTPERSQRNNRSLPWRIFWRSSAAAATCTGRDLPAEENSPEPAPAEPCSAGSFRRAEPHAEPETSAAVKTTQQPEGLRFTPTPTRWIWIPGGGAGGGIFLRRPLLPEEEPASETQIIHFPHQPVPEEDGKPAAETTATEASSEENAPEEEPAEEPQGSAEARGAPKSPWSRS